MIELNLVQGSPEWLAHRAKYRNASDTPSVTGSSTYKSRAEFLKERATGIIPEVDAATQRRFDDGHRFEALARPLMEKIIGEDLFPVVGVDGLYSSSFDGLTMMGDTNGEHKTLNDAIRACQTAADLPLMYREQMEHQMMVSGAVRSLFFASKWTLNDSDEYELEEERHFWYEPDMALRQKICASWDQFEIDKAAYIASEVIPAAVATPTLDLPVVSIQTSGAIAIRSNLRAFGEALNSFIERLPTKPSTDQEFADCKAALTKLKTAEETLDSEEARALSQMTEIDEMRREKKLYQDLARTTRLALEKLVTARESAIKVEIVAGGKAALAEHIVDLNTRLGKTYMPVVAENFATVIKNKRTITSLRDAVDTELARCKIAANEVADKIQINLQLLDDHKDYAFLFNDVATLVMKAKEDLYNVIKIRIDAHEAEQQKKLDAEREKIRKEEEEKAAQKVKDDAEAARLAAESAVTPACDSYRPVIQPNTNLIEPIFAQPVGQKPDVFFKTQALVKFLDDENFSEAEIDLVQHYAEKLVIRRQEAA